MEAPFSKKLFYRELTDPAVRSKSYRKLYQDVSLVNDLDIVNELDGHSGCVNALSWSKSGRLLASGSDDQHLNVHTYQPSTTCDQFQLALTVATGHTQNIFSVKFMPHSNDRTVITAAGDCEVRIFDLEYSGQVRTASAASVMAAEGRRRGRRTRYDSVKYLTDGDTNCRVYRSHGDRVKRIVTESSPHLFLTCSEDGEVRQWDLRQPSSAYPSPPRNQFSLPSDHTVPPPLISYKRYSLDLNTISCSASQPHYIALGGAHVHAFLHDRRMTGRDRLKEQGRPLSPISNLSADEQELLSQATQCVRKFAPKGQRKMNRHGSGYITACKISDARPDEMIASWMGDHIYKFDLIRDPDIEEVDSTKPLRNQRLEQSSDRKRKRQTNASETSLAATATASSRQRTSATRGGALRIHYQNGQSEEIPIQTRDDQQRMALTSSQQEAQRIAKVVVKIRQSLFRRTLNVPSTSASTFTVAIGHAASIISDIDETMRNWGYPMDPSPEQVYYQRKLRSVRESTRRFVQAAGTLSRALGGRLQTPSGSSPLMAHFCTVESRSNDMVMTAREWFGYDFLKAILLWLESGIGSLVEGFTCPEDVRPGSKAASRLPIPAAEAGAESLDEYLIPYLIRLASDKPVFDFEVNRFEIDDNRRLFATERDAVVAFAAAVKVPFGDLSSTSILPNDDTSMEVQDRQIAQRYWALRVARGILSNATVNFGCGALDRAFGGLGLTLGNTAVIETSLTSDSDIEEEPDTAMTGLEAGSESDDIVREVNTDNDTSLRHENRLLVVTRDDDFEDGDAIDSPTESTALLEEIEESQSRHATVEAVEDHNDDFEVDEDDTDNYDDNYDENDESSDPDEEDGVPNLGSHRYLYRSTYDRGETKSAVEADVPAAGPTRMYQGHCNVKTVKDVNFFGPDDEYVVSGSDDGNFFIWDKTTSRLVNILEGDGEVVNVIQGHPYENMLAVSGIDHTIKIFSPDARAREVARLSRGISSHDPSTFSSIAWPMRIGRLSRRARESQRSDDAGTTSEPTLNDTAMDPDEDEDYVAPSGLKSRKRMDDAQRIMHDNNIQREGGNEEAMITRALLAQLAQRASLYRARARAGQHPPQTNDPRPIEADDDCIIQ